MRRTLSLILLTAASAVLLGLLLLPGALSGTAGAVLFAVLVTLVPVALIALGAVRGRGGGLGRLAWSLAALAVLLAGSAAAVVLLSGAREPALLGLPPATVVALAGLWLLPLPLVALAYALTFHRHGVTGADLEELRRRVGAAPGSEPGRSGPGGRGRQTRDGNGGPGPVDGGPPARPEAR